MLDISNVPVIDSRVEIKKFMSIYRDWCIRLDDYETDTIIRFGEKMFNKYFKALKEVMENPDKYHHIFATARGYKWFQIHSIDRKLYCNSYIRLDRVPIYIEMFKHIDKFKIYLDRDSLLAKDLYVLKEVNDKIQKRQRLRKVDGKPYINI
jgi:hypothetical protein